MKEKRFHVDKAGTVNGYHLIGDNNNEDNPIWIDCNPDYLDIIVDALNNITRCGAKNA